MTWLKAQWLWITTHKTRLVGYAAGLAGAIQAYLPEMGVFLSVKQMAATTLIVGVTVAIIGHINAHEPPP
jgi:hypothetical protein